MIRLIRLLYKHDRTYPVGYFLDRKYTNFKIGLPKYLGSKIRYWVINFEAARHIEFNEIVPEVTAMDILKRSHKEAYGKR